MKVYEIRTLEKKNISHIETWTNEEMVEFDINETYRWGKVVISVEDDEDFNVEEVGNNEYGFCVSDYCVEDQDLDDGVSLYFEGFETEELQEQVEEIFDVDSYTGLEEAGYSFVEAETWFYGPLEVKEIK